MGLEHRYAVVSFTYVYLCFVYIDMHHGSKSVVAFETYRQSPAAMLSPMELPRNVKETFELMLIRGQLGCVVCADTTGWLNCHSGELLHLTPKNYSITLLFWRVWKPNIVVGHEEHRRMTSSFKEMVVLHSESLAILLVISSLPHQPRSTRTR